MEWKRIFVWTGCGMTFFFAGISARHISLRCLERRWTLFSSRSPHKKSMMRAAGVHLMWSGEWGWEVSQATRTRPPVPSSHDVPGGGCTIRMRLGLPSLRASGARKEARIHR